MTYFDLQTREIIDRIEPVTGDRKSVIEERKWSKEQYCLC